MDEIILHDNDEDNFSYSDVLKRFQHPVASKRRDPRSVRLAAVTSAVLDIAGTDNSSAAQVYAKAIAALEGTLTTTTVVSLQDAGNAVSTQCAILELLAVTIPHVTPPAILSATLPLTSRIFRALVLTATTSAKQHPTTASVEEIGGTNALLRWICRVSVGVLLCIAPNTEAKAVKQFFLGTLIAMFRDKRPKVRKAAHTGVLELLARQSETNRPSTHSAIYFEVEEYIHRELMSAKEMKGDADFQDVLHLLPFVERSILYLNYRKLGVDLMEFITSLLHGSAASSDASDFLTAVKVKENSPKILLLGSLLSIVLFMIQDDDASRSAFLDEFAPRVLASLIQAKPMVVFASGSVEHEILGNTKSIYGQLVLASCSRIIDSKQDLIYKLLPLAIQLVLQLSCPGNGVDHGAAVTNVANTLFVELTQLFRTNFSFLLNMGNKETLATCLQNVLKCVSTVMDPSFRDTWNISLKALAVLLQQVFSTIDVQSCVNSFVDLRFNGPKSSQRVVESAVSALIQGIGIEAFWNLINWQSTPKTKGVAGDIAWVITTMRSAASTSQPDSPRLAFFQSNVLGLARICDKAASVSSSVEQKVQRKRVVELWSLFPYFCRSPSDIAATIPSLTPTLSRALEDKRYPEIMTAVSRGLSTLVTTFDVTDGGFELDNASADGAALNTAAVLLLPVLFKIVSDTHAAVVVGTSESIEVDEKSATSSEPSYVRLQCVTEAISAMARLASEDFVSGLFKKIMHRLLEEIQSESGEKEKVCSLLTLSQALVASKVLDDSSISFLYRALKPLIMNDEEGSRVQKRAYKVLSEICEQNHPFIADVDRLKETTALLTDTVLTSQISARYMRLKCLNIIIEGFDETHAEQLKEIHKILPEILLCLKDANAKTREIAYQLLLSLTARGDIVEFVKVIVAALGAETSHMRSAVIMALSRIVFEQGWENEEFQVLVPSLLRTVLLLIDEGSREVTKSVVGFIRISVAAIPRDQLEPLLPDLVGSLLKSQQAKSRFRAKIKIILKKLVKIYGYESLMPFVPESEKRLLTHMRKLGEREKRKKLALRESGRPEVDQFDTMVDSDEDDSDDGRTLMTGATGLSRAASKGQSVTDKKSVASARTKQTGKGSIATTKSKMGSSPFRIPDESDGVIVDMLGSSMAKRVHFASNANDKDSDSDSDIAMEFDDDGKLLVPNDEDDDDKHSLEADEVVQMQGNSKRRRLAPGPEQKGKKGNDKRGLGASYKSKKAGGDVKTKGQQFEPYAFVPLDGRAYTKKNRRSAVEQMTSVVRKGGKRKR